MWVIKADGTKDGKTRVFVYSIAGKPHKFRYKNDAVTRMVTWKQQYPALTNFRVVKV